MLSKIYNDATTLYAVYPMYILINPQSQTKLKSIVLYRFNDMFSVHTLLEGGRNLPIIIQ